MKMAKESDMSIFKDLLEPFRRAINTDPPKDKLSASSKLNFSDSNPSIKEENAETSNDTIFHGKRKSFTIGCTPEKRIKTEAVSTKMSPWQIQKTKIDLIAAKAEITKLEARINHQHSIRKEMQILFEEEKASLIEQHKKDEKSIAETEKRIEFVRRREQVIKDQLEDAKKTHALYKQKWDADKTELQKEVEDLKEKLLEANASSGGQISEMKKDMDELLVALEGAQSELEVLKKELERQTAKVEQCSSLRSQLETQTLELQQMSVKVKELEYERDSFNSWEKHAKEAQKRLSTLNDLEKEVTRLRTTNRNLRDAVGNKLLLEEQANSMSAKLEALKPIQQELQDAKVKIAILEATLEQWQSVGRARGLADARALGAALDKAMQKELDSFSDCSKAQSQLAQLNEDISTLKYERDKATGKANDLQTVKKNHESLIQRLQKRLLLVTRERDSYRQQLDSYEKELSVSAGAGAGAGAGGAALLAARVEPLERALQGYRELLAQHDLDANAKLVDNLRTEVAKWREEAELQRRDVAKLRAQRDNLQAHIEKLQPGGTKVLHLADNPAAAAQKQIQNELEAAQEEITKLKAALKDGSQECPEEVAKLKQQLDNSKLKLQRMKEEFTSSAQEYRDVCYMLLGYKIDRTGHKNYRLSNMYAESADEYLTFTLYDHGIEMVHTEYSSSLSELVQLHLHHHQSIPLFLSALTAQLFTATTALPEPLEDHHDHDDDH